MEVALLAIVAICFVFVFTACFRVFPLFPTGFFSGIGICVWGDFRLLFACVWRPGVDW